MSIKAKMFLLALGAVAMVLLLGISSLFGIRTLQQALDDVAVKGIGHSQALSEANSKLFAANLSAYRLFATMVNFDAARIQAETATVLGHADGAIKILKDMEERSDLQAEERQTLAELAEPLAQYRKLIAQAIDMAESDLPSGTGMMQAADKRFLKIKEELGKMIDDQKAESNALTVAATAAGDRSITTSAVVFLVSLIGCAAVSFILSGKIVGPLLDAIRTARSIAGGDLTNRIEISGKDETGDLLRALADMQTNLRSLIGQIEANVQQTATSCSLMSSAFQNINQSVHAQNDATAAVAAAIEEMSVSITSIHDNASHALSANRKSAEFASQGVRVTQSASAEMLKISATVKDAAEVIERVGQQTNEISSIVKTIREVADQTNLLALNAAIEAARAGESGRGFAVVADEVRKLAEKTTSSSEEIRRMIEAVQLSSGNAVDTIRQMVNQMEITASHAANAQEAIERIQASSKQSEGHAQDIAAALGEHSSTSHLIAQQVENITCMSNENAQSIAQAGQAMQEFEDKAGILNTAVKNFKI
ncbi:putative methyl-accepting chemotaxis protein [Sterolibacterium denitrificans]|uniref:Methyl-accepting chemotaxis protein n=1 Tax=Sterolibacterium denitrificans TaxID=157592 RepID=A0A7Z7MVX2_9PROT|nr:methyl-accepting chemotaxis protein [Sterolibacterium denitrificans]SMB29621.1 putative methyl-accepting chemotaxis protein [Sterolibacterium denitrificans]